MIFSVIGGDKRTEYLRSKLLKDGHKLTYQSSDADIIIMPMPLTADGIHILNTDIEIDEYLRKLPKDILVFGGGNREGVIDYSKDNSLAALNAIPTAEGALALAIENTSAVLWKSRCLVVGSGRIGKYLSGLLKAMGSYVTLSSRREEDRVYSMIWGYSHAYTNNLLEIISDQDIIFNTVPSRVIGEAELSRLKQSALIIELSSKPYGVDLEMASQMGVKTILASGLPGKVAPQSAGEIIGETIYRLISEMRGKSAER
ncbi:MAG: dipicolinate synthase subunit DpsA [Clostridiaceae bacterium]|nr:dipicolinate synthase subunit DpsA [Clostridiaceae bacterium]